MRLPLQLMRLPNMPEKKAKRPSVRRRVYVRANHPLLLFSPAQIRRLFCTLDKADELPVPPGELSVALLGRAQIVDLHARFLNDPTPTDVITFDGDPTCDFAGEICVSVDQALEVCQRYGNDFATELTLYLVHGWLHLAGYDDHNPDDIAAMRAAEKRALQWLADNRAMPLFSLKNA